MTLGAPRHASRHPLALVTFLILSSFSARTAWQDAERDPSRAAKLVTRWTIVINQQFEESKATPTDESLELLDELMSVGAVRAVRDHATDRQLQAADANMARFIIAMAKASARQPDGSVELDAAAFGEALRALCPLQLFCESGQPPA